MNILIVSPYFPPEKTVAIMRISSLVRELLKEGHDLTVIRNIYNKHETNELKSDPDLKCIKQYEVKVDNSVRFFEAKKRYEKIFRQIMNREKFDLVFITAGPFYTIPLCKIAKKDYNTKCIIDYRDLWVFDIRTLKEFFKPVNIIKKIIYFPIEKNNIRYADLVVTVTEDWKKILTRVYRTNKVKVIPNGYDEEKIKNIGRSKHFPYKDKYVVTIFGKLSYYSIKYGIKFFKAFKYISEKYSDIIILHIGLPENETERAIEVSGFDKQKYINTGFISYEEGIQLLKESNVNVIIDVRKGAMGTKFYDYILVNKPIVYFGKKDTRLDNAVRQFENGFSCYDENDLIETIFKIRKYDLNLLTTDNIFIKKHSRNEQNKKYIKLMKKIVK